MIWAYGLYKHNPVCGSQGNSMWVDGLDWFGLCSLDAELFNDRDKTLSSSTFHITSGVPDSIKWGVAGLLTKSALCYWWDPYLILGMNWQPRVEDNGQSSWTTAHVVCNVHLSITSRSNTNPGRNIDRVAFILGFWMPSHNVKASTIEVLPRSIYSSWFLYF